MDKLDFSWADSLSPENRQIVLDFKNFLSRYKRLKTGPKRIEIVSNNEIYLLDREGERRYKICGRRLSGMPDVFRCSMRAGVGTSHLGAGVCYHHEQGLDRTQPKINKLWDMLNKEAGVPSTLAEVLEHAKQIDKNILDVVDPEIRILYGLLGYVATKNKNVEGAALTQTDINTMIRITEKIARIKLLRRELEAETKLDMETITIFLKEIFKIISKYTSDTIKSQIMISILDNVIKPYKKQKKIVNMSEIEDASFMELTAVIPILKDINIE